MKGTVAEEAEASRDFAEDWLCSLAGAAEDFRSWGWVVGGDRGQQREHTGTLEPWDFCGG